MNRKKAIIIGKHPLVESLKQQYEALQTDVSHFVDEDTLPSKSDLNACDELFVLTDPSKRQDEDIDSKAIALLGLLADKIDADALKGKRIICHLMLQSQRALQHLRTNDFCAPIKQMIDVYPFTMEEVWSRSIALDHIPITIQSEQHAHLVIFGMNELAYMVAIHATETAHYPNYVRDHSLRTRITLVDEQARTKYGELIQRYPQFQTHYDNLYGMSSKPSNRKWWLAAAVFMIAAIAAAVVAVNVRTDDSITKKDILPFEESIFLLKVDSVSKVMTMQGKEELLCPSKVFEENTPTGTAFLTTDGMLVTGQGRLTDDGIYGLQRAVKQAGGAL